MNKLYFNKKFYTLLILLLFNSVILSQWQKTNGIKGGYFNHIAGDRTNLLAVTSYGTTFLYSNGEWDYRSSSNYLEEVYKLQDKWVGFYTNSIFISEDDGLNWQNIIPQPTSSFLVQAKIIEDKIYAITTDTLYSTSDFGNTWNKRVFSDSITAGSETGIFFLQDAFYVKDSIMLASGFTSLASNFNVVAYSSDFGQNWLAGNFPNGIQNIAVSDFLSDDSFYYLANGAGFFKSINGIDWIEMNEGLPISNGSMITTKFLKNNNGLLAIVNSSTYGLYAYDGNIWNLLYDENYPTDFTVNNDEIIFCAKGNVIKYDENNNQVLSENIIASTSRPLVSSNRNVFSIYNSKLYRTTDDGDNWEVIKDTASGVLAIKGDTLFTTSQTGILRSDDNGTSWSAFSLGIPITYVPKLNAVGLANGNIYAGFNGTRARMHLPPVWEQGGVYVSSDDGETWNSLNNGLPQEAGIPSPVYQIFADGSVVLLNTVSGRFSLVNDAWVDISLGFPSNTYVSTLMIYNDDVIFATNNGLFISHDKGVTKEDFNDGLPGFAFYTIILFSYQNELYVFSTYNNIVYKHENNQWNESSFVFPENIRLTFLQSFGNLIYAGTYDNGIWKYDPTPTTVEDIVLPQQFSLSQNYPNPFNPSTTIKFNLAENGNVRLIIFDILGKEVVTLLDENKNAGEYQINFNASSISSGIYFYKLITNNFVESKKMILLK